MQIDTSCVPSCGYHAADSTNSVSTLIYWGKILKKSPIEFFLWLAFKHTPIVTDIFYPQLLESNIRHQHRCNLFNRFKQNFKSSRYSKDPEIIDNVIQNTNYPFHIIDHPMRPFGMRYLHSPDYFDGIEDFLDRSPQACSWLRDLEYLVDFKYYDDLELKDGRRTHYLHVFPKVRSVLTEKSSKFTKF